MPHVIARRIHGCIIHAAMSIALSLRPDLTTDRQADR